MRVKEESKRASLKLNIKKTKIMASGPIILWQIELERGFPVAQLVKNLPATQETWVQSLGWEDPLEKGKATHSSIMAWRIPRTVCSPWVTKSWTWLSDFHFHFQRRKKVEVVTDFLFLSSKITAYGDCSHEIRRH